MYVIGQHDKVARQRARVTHVLRPVLHRDNQSGFLAGEKESKKIIITKSVINTDESYCTQANDVVRNMELTSSASCATSAPKRECCSSASSSTIALLSSSATTINGCAQKRRVSICAPCSCVFRCRASAGSRMCVCKSCTCVWRLAHQCARVCVCYHISIKTKKFTETGKNTFELTDTRGTRRST